MPGNAHAHGCLVSRMPVSYRMYRDLGYRFVVRYPISDCPQDAVTRSEIAVAHNAGIDVCLMWDNRAEYVPRTYEAGSLLGSNVLWALAALGAPDTVAGWVNLFARVDASNSAAFDMWLSGFVKNLLPYRAGIRADSNTLRYVSHFYPQVYQWDNAAWTVESNRNTMDMMHLGGIMLANQPCELNVAYSRFYGQWCANPADQPISARKDDMTPIRIRSGEAVIIPFLAGSAMQLLLAAPLSSSSEENCCATVSMHSEASGDIDLPLITGINTSTVVIPFTHRDIDSVTITAGAMNWPDCITAVVI